MGTPREVFACLYICQRLIESVGVISFLWSHIKIAQYVMGGICSCK